MEIYFRGSSRLREVLAQDLSLALRELGNGSVEGSLLLIEVAPHESVRWQERYPQCKVVALEPDIPADALEALREQLHDYAVDGPRSLAMRVWLRNRAYLIGALRGLQEGELSRARYLAHQLAGCLGSFGLEEAGRLATQIESHLQNGNREPIPSLTQELASWVEKGPPL